MTLGIWEKIKEVQPDMTTRQAMITAVHHLRAKVTAAHTITVVVTVAALAAATCFWIATLDGVPAVGWYRLGLTVVFAGALLAWIIALRSELRSERSRNRDLENRVAALEHDLDHLMEDAHIRKVIARARKSGIPLVIMKETR